MKAATWARSVQAVATAALFVVALVRAMPAAHAEIVRTGAEPWYEQSTADARRQAQALFAQAIDRHLQLLRGDARELYAQALAQWDNPDIRWNQALVLDDLGQYLLAYQQLEEALRWGEALGAERLREIRNRMQTLEIQRLARIEAYTEEPGAEITLDGRPWFRGAGVQSTLVAPGDHYVAARKAGFFPVTRSVTVTVGQRVHVTLPMDADRVIETRRWRWWKPWGVASAGALILALGLGLEWHALVQRDTAASQPPGSHCTGCIASRDIYDRAVTESRLAVGAYVVGGTSMMIGLTLVWLNRLQTHRTEARLPTLIELAPLLSSDHAGISARLRF